MKESIEVVRIGENSQEEILKESHSAEPTLEEPD